MIIRYIGSKAENDSEWVYAETETVCMAHGWLPKRAIRVVRDVPKDPTRPVQVWMTHRRPDVEAGRRTWAQLRDVPGGELLPFSWSQPLQEGERVKVVKWHGEWALVHRAPGWVNAAGLHEQEPGPGC